MYFALDIHRLQHCSYAQVPAVLATYMFVCDFVVNIVLSFAGFERHTCRKLYLFDAKCCWILVISSVLGENSPGHDSGAVFLPITLENVQDQFVIPVKYSSHIVSDV